MLLRSLLFADVRGYSRLTGFQITQYLNSVIPRIAGELSGRTAFTNTWGDGLFCVSDHPSDAIEAALGLVHLFETTPWEQSGLPSDLAVRVALHLGSCERGLNPITGREEFLGVDVNLTARIEPIVGPNQVWATEAFVGVLQSGATVRWHTRDLGVRELFKNWGPMRLFRLSRHEIDVTAALAGTYWSGSEFPVRGLHHVSLPVRNLDRSVDWYRKRLHLREAEDPEIADKNKERPDFGFPGRWLEFPEGGQLHLIEYHEMTDRPVTFRAQKNGEEPNFKDIHFAVRVRHHQELFEILCKDGERPVLGPLRDQYYIADPDGHIVEVTGIEGPGPKRESKRS